MAYVPLRAYLRKIEGWIEESQNDKAIFMSFLVLKKFPRNFKTYQILSKALLQGNKFLKADNIFDIILQIEPDDFVSLIGKSMIAEGNGNLVSAITYMKNAFELQPANEGLQNELKRLLLLKEGVEPNKITLTRGALIKMYLKGKLFQQAIAESRIGLSENPQRIDYRIAMAKAFFESGDFIQSVETAVEIVSQLPYCLSANEILDKVVTKKLKVEKAGFYRKRLVELDPYYAFMLPDTNSILDIPDIAVLIEDQSDLPEYEYDLIAFIENIWKDQPDSYAAESISPDEVDWETIISKAADSVSIETEIITEGNDIVVDTESKIVASKKDAFLDRMRPTKASSAELEDSSNWYFDQSGEIAQGERQNSQILSQDFANSSLRPDLDPGHGEKNINRDDIFDTEVNPEILIGENIDKDEYNWSNDEPSQEQMAPFINETNLDDTQQIKITGDDPNDLLIKSEKAIEGGNVQFAMTTIRKLIADKKYLKDIVLQLERALSLYPENPEIRLLLGETYTKLEEKEKALAIFQKAQKNITL